MLRVKYSNKNMTHTFWKPLMCRHALYCLECFLWSPTCHKHLRILWPSMQTSQNGQTFSFKYFVALTASFSKCALPFWDIAHLRFRLNKQKDIANLLSERGLSCLCTVVWDRQLKQQSWVVNIGHNTFRTHFHRPFFN